MTTNPTETTDLPHTLADGAERGAANLGDTRRSAPRGARTFLWITILAVIGIAGGLLFGLWNRNQDAAPVPDDLDVAQSGIANRLSAPKVARPLPAPPPVPEPMAVPELLTLPEVDISVAPPEVPKLDEVTQRRLKSPLSAENGQGNAQTETNAKNGPEGPYSDAGPLADRLRPLELAPSVAEQLGDRNFLLTQGTMIDCTLQTRLISTQPGLLTCLATHDVMSANGKVKLIDAGTKFTGYQDRGIVQGQARAFINWHRLETPTGVIVNIASPGTGPLGAAGVNGAIDTHFWERFGNAILLSLIGDMGEWVANRGQRGDNNMRFDNTREGTQDVITKILEKSIDIPPTLYTNQGERIGIMVARDLDFSKVYGLEPVY